VTHKVVDIIRLIPGYDPFRDAKDFYFDTAEAQKVLDFFEECLRFIEGGNVAGKPFVMQPWQMAVVCNIFGWKEITTGFRRYKEVMLYVPRKNGKTPLAAGIVIYCLFCDKEAGKQIYSAAADREQAALVYRHAKGMIAVEPELAERCVIYKSMKSIEFKGTPDLYRALSSDAETKHGLNANVIITDELHAHKKRDLVDTLETSQASRDQPLMIHTTTADYNRPSICNEKYGYAVMVRDGMEGACDPSYLPILYEAKLDDDWTDPKVWRKANPNFGISVTETYIRNMVSKAKLNVSKQNPFKRLHLNIRTESADRLFDMEHWRHQKWKKDRNETAQRWRARMMGELRGKRCYAGLDLSSTNDLTGFSLWFPEDNIVLPFCWCPGESMEIRQREKGIPYLEWANMGFIEPTSGRYIDQTHIFNSICSLGQMFHIAKIGFDRWGAQWMYVELAKHGFDCLRYGQGFGEMTGPVKRVAVLLGQLAFNHGGNPVLEWCFRNASGVYKDAPKRLSNDGIVPDSAKDGQVRPDKQTSGEKIDLCVSTLMAIGVADSDEDPTVYETQGIKQLDTTDPRDEFDEFDE
jgi:phage terminase large subunit-like protein